MDLSTKPDWWTALPSKVVATTRSSGQSAVLLVCEHASRFIPAGLSQLGLDETAAQSHIAWDPGALQVAEQLSEKLDATLISQEISRLVYDCNRPPESAQAIWTQSEIYNIPGNTGLSAEEKAARTDYIYRPFLKAVSEGVSRHPNTVLVTVHTFTPVYNGNARAVEIGILHDSDSRLADAMLSAAAQNPGFNTQRNAPYGPSDGVTHTLKEHALPRGLLNVMVEIRNDLVSNKDDVNKVAAWLHTVLVQALSALDGES